MSAFVGPDPASTEGEITRFPEIRAARTVEDGLYLVVLILWVAHFLALYRALRGTSLAPALFGSVVGIVGLGVLAAGALPHVAAAPISELYHAPGASPEDQATLVLIWQATQGIFDALFGVGLLLVPLGFIALGVAMLGAPAFGKGYGLVGLVVGAVGEVAAAMKAIVQDKYGPADVLELSDVEKPQPGDDELHIRVHAAGVDPGVWHLMTGLPYLVRVMGFGLRKPKIRIRGTDVAGTVEVAGRNVTQFKEGDQVYGTCDGSFAEYACAKAERVAPKPANLSFEQAATVPVSGVTALNGMRDAGKIQPGQKVLIIGAAGGVGSYAVQLAKAFGAVVTGVCSTSKAELVRAIGADEVVDYTREDFTDGAHQFDLILDTAGRRPLSQLRQALTPQGTLVIVGGEGGERWLGGFQRQIFAPVRSPLTEQKLLGLISKERRQDLLTLK